MGDTQPIYSRQTTAFRVSYPSELRQKPEETLKNPSGFISCLSYQDVKSHPGPSTVKDAIATSRPDCSATDLPSLDGQITPRASLSPSSPFRKNNSACAVGQISGSSSRVPPHKRGVSRSSRTLMRDAVDAFGARDECTNKRTAKSCGLDASTLALTRDNASHCAGMVTRKPDHQREHEGNR